MVYVADYEWKEPKEVITQQMSREDTYRAVNDYAISNKKTFILGSRRLTLMDNGGIIFADYEFYPSFTKYIKYDPDKRRPWSFKKDNEWGTRKSKTITDLELGRYNLNNLYRALKAANKQDLIDNEIAIVE